MGPVPVDRARYRRPGGPGGAQKHYCTGSCVFVPKEEDKQKKPKGFKYTKALLSSREYSSAGAGN